jgi:hypothetical protein
MDLENNESNIFNKLKNALEVGKAKMRKHLMGMSKEDRFRSMRQDLSQKGIETLCEWALPEEDYEICATVEEIKANNIDTFKIRFSLDGESNNKALIVKFLNPDGRIYYHADYILHNDIEGSLVMLHLNGNGEWTSEWKSNDPKLFFPIGEAIKANEKKS